MPPASTCSADDMATSESQCSAGTVPQLPPVSTGPTKADLNSAQNSGMLSGTGDKPVSPAPTYSVVTAPGVARAIGSSSVPASANIGLGPAPLEAYVKMLVNSQLAAQGVPTNEPFAQDWKQVAGSSQQAGGAMEPFQVNEATAIPNASDYMKKVFRGVFN